MKWRLCCVPKFMKLMTLKNIVGSESISGVMETEMYVFCDWIGRQLGKKKKIQIDDLLRFEISEKEDRDTIIHFSSFYRRMVCDPFTGKCSWYEKYERVRGRSGIIFVPGVTNETFIYETSDRSRALGFTIEKVEAKEKKAITIRIITYEM